MQVDNLYLFPSHTQNGGAFPVCTGGTMSWQSVGGKTHLVCGDAPEVQECTKHAFNTDTRAEDAGYCCESDGSVTFTNSSGTLEGWDKDVAEGYGYYCCDTLYVKTKDHDPNNPWIVYNPNQTYEPLGGIQAWSCTGNGSTEPVCNWNSGEKVVHENQKIDYQAGELFEKAGGDSGPATVEPVSLRDVANYHDTCTTGACAQGKTCVVNYTLSNCRAVGETTSDGKINFYSCTFTHTEKTCECN